jgi:hypothetical protein
MPRGVYTSPRRIRGESHHQAKLTDDEVRQIRRSDEPTPDARGGGGPNLGGGPRHGGRAFAEGGGPRSYAGRDFNRSGPKGDIRRGNAQAFNRDRDHGDRNHGDRNRRFAERDHDRNHDFDHRGRHRVFRNGVWVWVYGPDYYSYNDCWWLRERALATGSPYWWSRYNYCVGYY